VPSAAAASGAFNPPFPSRPSNAAQTGDVKLFAALIARDPRKITTDYCALTAPNDIIDHSFVLGIFGTVRG
jgi:hypothetical protein